MPGRCSPPERAKGTAGGPRKGLVSLSTLESLLWWVSNSPNRTAALIVLRIFLAKKAEGMCGSPPPRWPSVTPLPGIHALPGSGAGHREHFQLTGGRNGVCIGVKVMEGPSFSLSWITCPEQASFHVMRTLVRQPKEKAHMMRHRLPATSGKWSLQTRQQPNCSLVCDTASATGFLTDGSYVTE